MDNLTEPHILGDTSIFVIQLSDDESQLKQRAPVLEDQSEQL